MGEFRIIALISQESFLVGQVDSGNIFTGQGWQTFGCFSLPLNCPPAYYALRVDGT